MNEKEFLPEPLPSQPFALVAQWLETARANRVQPNPDAMVLATADDEGNPSARVVLCRHLITDPGFLVFFTNYRSRKGQELTVRPRAAAVFHWDAMSRQIRVEGPVVRSPAAESDAYFAHRPLQSRIGAWASRQSEPLSSRAQLERQVAAAMEQFGIQPGTHTADIPRPEHWGGFRLWPEAVELWIEGSNRVHERARWTRQLAPNDAYSFTPSSWQVTRLNP